jgi:hypothetical protein
VNDDVIQGEVVEETRSFWQQVGDWFAQSAAQKREARKVGQVARDGTVYAGYAYNQPKPTGAGYKSDWKPESDYQGSAPCGMG